MSRNDWDQVKEQLTEEMTQKGEVDEEAMSVARRLVRHGSYPARQLMRRPSMAIWLAHTRWRREPMPRRELRRELSAYLDAARLDVGDLSRSAVAKMLRVFRHRQLLRIFLREIEGASVRRTTAEVADVAEACLGAALAESARLQGEPSMADDICVIGMGKLGGRELNFSSDIDLVFAAADRRAGDGVDESLNDLVQTVVGLMDEVTDEGRVFRVDLRLRPEGSRGRLIPSESALVAYYLNWGRTWERGAWLKARPVAGNEDMGTRMLEQLEPFLYRRHLDFDAIDELRRMKQLIDEESRATDFVRTRTRGAETERKSSSTSPFKARLLKKFDSAAPTNSEASDKQRDSDEDSPSGWDVKIGRGGIREIEFFVQALQLVHCGLRPDLRVRTTLEALDRLLYTGLLSATEHADLVDAYDLFRRLEHRIQMEADRQSHQLPTAGDGFADLARRMEMSVDELRTALGRSRRTVRSMFERLFRESPRTTRRATVGEEREGTLERIIGLPSERLLDDSVVQRLRDAGFSRPRQVAGQLQVLRRKEYGPFSESPASADPQVARYLLGAVRDAPDPEGALRHLVQFATSVGDTPSTWAMLSDNPHAARLMIHLFGSSPPLGGLLAEEPDVFERLLYSGSARVVRSRKALHRDLVDQLDGVGDRARRMGRIRRFHREEVLRIALHEVAGAVDVETTCRQLTDVAELVVENLFREVVDDYFEAHGPLAPDGDPVASLGLAVVAMGKLGGREMGFGSDLDFFFIYDPCGDRGLEHVPATKLAKRLVRALSAATEIGDLYDVDLRLRPSGAQGTLVVSVDAWRDYHRHRAEFWERQALVRARCLTGAASLREQIEEGRRELAFQRSLPEDAQANVVSMRQRLRAEAQGGEEEFDVKYGDGGLVDVEFLTQWLQLSAGDVDQVWTHRSTFDVLRALDAAPVRRISGVDLGGLLRDYTWLRRLECRLSIDGLGSVVPGRKGPGRRALVRQMGHQGREGDQQFEAEFDAVRQRVRAAWRSVFSTR